MAAPPARSWVPLTGADCFLRAFDDEIRRRHGASHVSQLVLRLGPGFDAAIFQKLVHEVSRAQPLLRAPIRRRFGFGAPGYRLAAASGRPPPVHVHEAPGAGPQAPLPEVFARRLNEPLAGDRGELLCFDVVRYAGGAAGTDLAASWLHMLLDGHGSEAFVRWLDACARGAAQPGVLPRADELAPVARETGLRQAGDAARAWQRWIYSFGERPPASLPGPPARVRQALAYRVEQLSADETTRAVESARQRAGFLTPMLFYLAAAIRAHHAVFRARGRRAASYLVPLPVNLRPRGADGAIFRTQVSLLWFQVTPEEVEDPERLMASLKQQRQDAIRARQVENGAHAMDFARFAPMRLYAHMARRHLGGELCSFFFAFTGEFLPGLDRFLGAEIREGFHVAPVPPSPGSCLAMSLRSGRLAVTHTHQRGVFDPAELDILRAELRAALLG